MKNKELSEQIEKCLKDARTHIIAMQEQLDAKDKENDVLQGNLLNERSCYKLLKSNLIETQGELRRTWMEVESEKERADKATFKKPLIAGYVGVETDCPTLRKAILGYATDFEKNLRDEREKKIIAKAKAEERAECADIIERRSLCYFESEVSKKALVSFVRGDRVTDIVEFQGRELVPVLLRMLSRIPSTELDFKQRLSSLLESAKYSAPEGMRLWWVQVSTALEDQFGSADKIGVWQQEVVDIFMGKYKPS